MNNSYCRDIAFTHIAMCSINSKITGLQHPKINLLSNLNNYYAKKVLKNPLSNLETSSDRERAVRESARPGRLCRSCYQNCTGTETSRC